MQVWRIKPQAPMLMAEAIAAVPQLQLRLTGAIGRTAKQQTWAAELTSGGALERAG